VEIPLSDVPKPINFPINVDSSNSKGICPLRLTADQCTYHVIRFLDQ